MEQQVTISRERYQELLQCESDLRTIRNWKRKKGAEYEAILDDRAFLAWLEASGNSWFSDLREQWNERKQIEKEMKGIM